jgi:hypothetical protein
MLMTPPVMPLSYLRCVCRVWCVRVQAGANAGGEARGLSSTRQPAPPNAHRPRQQQTHPNRRPPEAATMATRIYRRAAIRVARGMSKAALSLSAHEFESHESRLGVASRSVRRVCGARSPACPALTTYAVVLRSYWEARPGAPPAAIAPPAILEVSRAVARPGGGGATGAGGAVRVLRALSGVLCGALSRAPGGCLSS